MAASGYPDPPVPLALMRGFTRRCPRCGRGKLFTGWFTMLDPCPRCGLAIERERASFLGSMTLNYAVTGLVFIGVLVVGVALTAPNVPVVPLFGISLVVTILTPLACYPFSKTVWAALDYLAHRNEPTGGVKGG